MTSFPKISWCTGLLNRTHLKTEENGTLNLYENNIRSLLNLKLPDEQWEFCIADYESDDVNIQDFFKNLKQEFNDDKFTYKIKTYPRKDFTRGGARNNSYKLTTAQIVFFLDADMLFKKRCVIDNIYRAIPAGFAYFPICASYLDASHVKYYKREAGLGNFAISKKLYSTNKEGWWEKKSWGKEDDKMFLFFLQQGKVVRDYSETFFHQWHPSLKHT